MITITIDRFDGTKKYQQSYVLEEAALEGKTVLGTLQHIKEKLDCTLNFTASCRCAICGACAVRVNGHAILSCDTKLEKMLKTFATKKLRISPLANFKVISDLVVDWEPAIDHLRTIHPDLVAKKEFSAAKGCLQKPKELDRVLKAWDCILCGICASECSKLAIDASDYTEPFVFTHAWRAALDSRSGKPMVHGAAALKNGLWRCVHCQACANACPKGISAADQIAGLRKLTMDNGEKSGVGPEHSKAFYTDLVEDSGRLNEVRMALRTEGLSTFGHTGMAISMLAHNKMSALDILGHSKIKGHCRFVKMVEAAHADAKEKK